MVLLSEQLPHLVAAVVMFEMKIGFDELDYQLYVAKNDPEQVEEFHEHSITEALDETDPASMSVLDACEPELSLCSSSQRRKDCLHEGADDVGVNLSVVGQ